MAVGFSHLMSLVTLELFQGSWGKSQPEVGCGVNTRSEDALGKAG